MVIICTIVEYNTSSEYKRVYMPTKFLKNCNFTLCQYPHDKVKVLNPIELFDLDLIEKRNIQFGWFLS